MSSLLLVVCNCDACLKEKQTCASAIFSSSLNLFSVKRSAKNTLKRVRCSAHAGHCNNIYDPLVSGHFKVTKPRYREGRCILCSVIFALYALVLHPN